jgi:hypothetical protein
LAVFLAVPLAAVPGTVLPGTVLPGAVLPAAVLPAAAELSAMAAVPGPLAAAWVVWAPAPTAMTEAASASSARYLLGIEASVK